MNNSIYSLNKLKELARRLDRENNDTPCHSENVASLALELCRALNIRGKRKNIIIAACLIHDIGKAVIDKAVWEKRGKFANKELFKIKMHPAISARLAGEAMLDKHVVEIVYYHHAWFNGNGYPDDARKKGTRIPMGARILAVCDAYDAMVSRRAYRDVVSREDALEELRKRAIIQFDPKVVQVFTEVFGETTKPAE